MREVGISENECVDDENSPVFIRVVAVHNKNTTSFYTLRQHKWVLIKFDHANVVLDRVVLKAGNHSLYGG